MPLLRATIVLRVGTIVLPAADGALARRVACSGNIGQGLGQRRTFTNWWHKWVDGKNPDSPPAVVVSKFLRSEGIDPYRLPRDELEDFRNKFLMEARWFAKAEDDDGKYGEACELLKAKRSAILDQWRDQHPLPPP
mmetsp:Transcript_127387/g.407731  ORF Transcript_127387/g.407731 Transcript_127387/m.407731 type:complete len:136 (-) Transcript_127387:64-471(-)